MTLGGNKKNVKPAWAKIFAGDLRVFGDWKLVGGDIYIS